MSPETEALAQLLELRATDPHAYAQIIAKNLLDAAEEAGLAAFIMLVDPRGRAGVTARLTTPTIDNDGLLARVASTLEALQ